MAEHNEIGKIGEDLASSFLMKQGFHVLGRNYRVLQGEIDIIAEKDNVLRFVEVKSVKVRDCNNVNELAIKPEDNVTFSKWSKLVTAIDIYLHHHAISHETPFQIDLACVYIDTERREGRVRLIPNIHKEQDS